METVILKNGAEEMDSVVISAWSALELLWEDSPSAISTLWNLAHGYISSASGPELKILQDRLLIDQDGKLHGSLRNIILSAFEVAEDGSALRLVNPVRKEQ